MNRRSQPRHGTGELMVEPPEGGAWEWLRNLRGADLKHDEFRVLVGTAALAGDQRIFGLMESLRGLTHEEFRAAVVLAGYEDEPAPDLERLSAECRIPRGRPMARVVSRLKSKGFISGGVA